MDIVLEHLLLAAFVGLFLLAAVLVTATLRGWLYADPKCVRCGCTEDRACDGGCNWAWLDPLICSRCF